MRLDEFLNTIKTSTPDDWKHLTSGPTYRGSFVNNSDSKGNAAIEYVEHDMVAVLKSDIDITVAWGLEPLGSEDLDFGFPAVFANTDASEQIADFFYRGVLVHRARLVSVDGHRALLPIAQARFVGESEDPVDGEIEYFDTKESCEIARLVHGFTHTEDFDEYLTRAGIIVVG